MAGKMKRGKALQQSPFWSPWANGKGKKRDQKHPKSIQCVVKDARNTVTKSGKPQRVLEVETFDGECFAVGCGGSLQSVAGRIEVGKSYEFEYVGEKEVGQPQPMNVVNCYPLVGEPE